MLMFSSSAIFDGTNTIAEPVLQCVQVKPIAGQQGGQERFRVVFSDILNFVQSMLASRMFFSRRDLSMMLMWYRGQPPCP